MDENNGPVAVLTPNDLHALSSILYFYERWLWSNLSPSAKRTKQVTEVQMLLVKVSLLGNAKITVLTLDEVEHITSAIRIFSTQLREKMPQSKNRDDVLESCEQLLSYIVTTFTPDKA